MRPELQALVTPRIAKLDRDQRGYPIPWFVARINGVADFRVADGEKFARAIHESLCWICGEKLGRFKTFVIGPMCAVNRISSEPPSHNDCAAFAAQVCPFLANPKVVRRESHMPTAVVPAAGVTIARNPGVTLVWTCERWMVVGDGRGGNLCKIGDPIHVAWFAEGRPATRAEVEESIRTGLPLLYDVAEKQGQAAVHALDRMHQAALRLLPAEEGLPA